MKRSAWKSVRRIVLRIALIAGVVVLAAQPTTYADSIPPGWKASNMRPIGYSGLNGLGESFKMAIKQVSGRWYLYMGHFAHRGWTILDVTNPTSPKVVKFIPGPANTSTFQVDLHDNLMLTSLQRSSANWGADPDKPFSEGVIIWDISDPANPKQLSHWKTGSTGVHRIGYPGGRYANLAANMPGYTGQILVFLDVSDPKNPKEAGRWWEPGQKEGEKSTEPFGSFHGPAIIDGNKAYLGYGPSVVILDISNISRPKLVGRLNFRPPFGGLVVHDVLPIPGKNLLYAHGEGTGGGDTLTGPPTCAAPAYLDGIVDIKDPARPRFISQFPLPEPPPGLPYTDFCDKGGRFGPHNTNLQYHLPDVEKQGDLIYDTYFNAGLRIYNIKEPRVPKEVGWFIPPTPTKRGTPIPQGKLVTQTEDVLVDTRGNIYITDKQWGVFVLRYTGPGQPAPTAK